MKVVAGVVAVAASLVGIAVASDEWINRKIERDQRPVAEILEHVQERQEAYGQDIQKNNEHRIRVEERERLQREGWRPPPQGE